MSSISLNQLKTILHGMTQKMKSFRGDWNQNDHTSDNYIWNRTHYEETKTVKEPIRVVWDGNVAGRTFVDADDVILCKVSDEVFSDEQMKHMRYNTSAGELVLLAEVWDEPDEGVLASEDITIARDIAVVRKPGIEILGVTIPEAGLYFGHITVEGYYVTELTSEELVEKTVNIVHQLDEKFLPSPSDAEFLEWMNDSGVVKPVAAASGELYTSSKGEIYIL